MDMMDNTRTLQLLKLIRDLGMPVGASFLCDKMDLPQATIGRLLLSLEQQGYLEKISNKGRVLTEAGNEYLVQQEQLQDKFDTACCLIRSVEDPDKQKLREVLEIRTALETITAAHACENANESDLQQLNYILQMHCYDLQHGGIGSEQDLQFHLKIASLSGNQTLFQLIKLLLTQENAYTKFSMVAPHVTDMQIQQHNDILAAIRDRDQEAAEKAMRAHLRQVADDVNRYFCGAE